MLGPSFSGLLLQTGKESQDPMYLLGQSILDDALW
jgi:hypothetical protein